MGISECQAKFTPPNRLFQPKMRARKLSEYLGALRQKTLSLFPRLYPEIG